ncbi:MAG: ABC transporter permease [Rubrivivax sp.]|nr:ABC transporter permease [Rubrivivax sp.]
MIDLLLAVRNLLRNRRRSFSTFFALAIGTASILLFGGFRANIQYSMHIAYVRDGGHLQIQHRDFFLYGNGNPTAYGIADYQPIIDAIERHEVLGNMVLVATPTLQFGGIASNHATDVSRTVVGMGTVAADLNRMRMWNEYGLPHTSPYFVLDGAPADAAIVGTGLARVLQLCEPLRVANCPKPLDQRPTGGEELPADVAALAAQDQPAAQASSPSVHPTIELLATSAGGAPNVVSLQVVRAERQGFKELDEILVMLQLAQAQRLVYGRTAPKATSIMVQLQRTDQLADARKHLEAVLVSVAPRQPLAILDFRELNPFFVQTIQMFDAIFGFIFALIGVIVLFTVGNTMSTAVVERTVEIGTIRALGLRRGGVQRLFVLEGALLGVAGALSGAAFAILASFAVNRMGLTWLPPGSGDRLPLLLVVWGETAMILGTTVGLILIAVASAWWPAHRASRLSIVDALRHA